MYYIAIHKHYLKRKEKTKGEVVCDYGGGGKDKRGLSFKVHSLVE